MKTITQHREEDCAHGKHLRRSEILRDGSFVWRCVWCFDTATTDEVKAEKASADQPRPTAPEGE